MSAIAHHFEEGGWAMYVILFWLVLAIGFAIERGVYLYKASINKDVFLATMQKCILAGDIGRAIKLCSAANAPLARIVKAGLMKVNRPDSEVQAAMDEAALRELPKIEARTPFLGLFANLAMLSGLFGTVLGLIGAFAAVAGADQASKATMLAKGISEAMNCTAFGLMSAIIALMAIGAILISQFNSVVKPVIIMTSVIMSTVGVLIGLMTFNMPFVIIMTGVGVISLAGIVVNNAIVLVDYIDVLRDRDGMSRMEALVWGGMTRFRPVVLTAVTTALGLVPLAIGLNFDFFGLYSALNPDLYWGGEQAAWWGPMAVAVIVGILFATVLTLIVVPVMYSLVDDLARFFRTRYLGERVGAGVLGGAAELAGGTEAVDGDGRPRRPSEVPAPVRV